MAGHGLRLWHLNDKELLDYFESTYPQRKPWRLCHLNTDTASAIHVALLCQCRPLPDAVRTDQITTKRLLRWHEFYAMITTVDLFFYYYPS